MCQSLLGYHNEENTKMPVHILENFKSNFCGIIEEGKKKKKKEPDVMANSSFEEVVWSITLC